MTLSIRILGLDPGLSAMGWGVIEVTGSRLGHVAHGVIATKPASGLGVRLMLLHQALGEIIQSHGPSAIAVEQAFVARDPQAALAPVFRALSIDTEQLDDAAAMGDIRTPSARDARKQLHGGSIGRWRNYAKHMGPVRGALGL